MLVWCQFLTDVHVHLCSTLHRSSIVRWVQPCVCVISDDECSLVGCHLPFPYCFSVLWGTHVFMTFRVHYMGEHEPAQNDIYFGVVADIW